MKRRHAFIIGTALLVSLSACSVDTPKADRGPEMAAKSSVQLPASFNDITTVLNNDVKQKRIPGAVMLVAQKGEIVYFANVGLQDRQTGTPMVKNSIFRIYSMTKPIVSAGIMMLYEEGKLNLEDPLSRYLPEFRNMKVVVNLTDESEIDSLETVPAERDITIKQLLTHTSGLTYGIFGDTALHDLYLVSDAPSENQTNAQMSAKLSKLPLRYQPGTRWEYSRSTDVLGRLIEVVSQKPLNRFLEERIFAPLGMKDSGFYVKKPNQSRIAEPDLRNLAPLDSPPKLLSGGGGLASTAEDYYRFLQMILNGGELDGVRVLKEKTVSLMTRDHLGPLANRDDRSYAPGKGYGFGLGFAVRIKEESVRPGTVGDLFWGGYGGTNFWIDPKNELIEVFMIQNPSMQRHYAYHCRKWVYDIIRE